MPLRGEIPKFRSYPGWCVDVFLIAFTSLFFDTRTSSKVQVRVSADEGLTFAVQFISSPLSKFCL